MVASSSGFGAVESCDEGGKSKKSLFEKFKLRVFEIAQQGEKK